MMINIFRVQKVTIIGLMVEEYSSIEQEMLSFGLIKYVGFLLSIEHNC